MIFHFELTLVDFEAHASRQAPVGATDIIIAAAGILMTLSMLILKEFSLDLQGLQLHGAELAV